MIRRHIILTGNVQGVGLRYRAKYAASMLGISGWARNLPDGSAEMEIQGDKEKLDLLIELLQESPYIDITGIQAKELIVEQEYGFEIRDDAY